MKSNKSKVINTLKMLSLDMIDNAGYGDCKAVLRNAPIFYSLFTNGLMYNPNELKWINRDRFVLTNGSVVPLFYSSLYLAGYPVDVNDLSKYNQKDFKTPYNIDYHLISGLDFTLMDNGEGISYSVGLALAEKYYNEKITSKKNKILNYNVYVFCSYDELLSGTSMEAFSFATENGLNNLVVLCDMDGIEDTNIDKALDGFGFKTIKSNGNNIDNILELSHDIKEPLIVFINAELSKEEEQLNYENGMLNKAAINELRRKYDVCSIPFEVLKPEKDFFNKKVDNYCLEEYNFWLKDYEAIKDVISIDKRKLLEGLGNNKLEILFDSDKFKINSTYTNKISTSNKSVMDIVLKKYPSFISADTTNSILVGDKSYLGVDNYCTNNVDFKNRYNAMGGIINGMVKEGLLTSLTTEAINIPKMISSIKFAVKMNLPTIYVFNNDSVFNNSVDLNSKPISELNYLRMIPGLTVIRPGDVNEVFGAWEYALKYRKPVAIIISDEVVNKNDNTNAKFVAYGAYMVLKENNKLDGVIIASGSDLKRAMYLAEKFNEKDKSIRVVSIPSIDLFENQKKNYEELLLPKDVPIIVIDSSSSNIWNRFATSKDHIISIDNYPIPSNKEELMDYYYFTDEDLFNKINNLL